jgi:hypothetical protein
MCPPLKQHAMIATPDNIKAIIRKQGHGGIKRAIRESYWDMYKLGYNKKEMKETLMKEFGTEDTYIRQTIDLYFL